MKVLGFDLMIQASKVGENYKERLKGFGLIIRNCVRFWKIAVMESSKAAYRMLGLEMIRLYWSVTFRFLYE